MPAGIGQPVFVGLVVMDALNMKAKFIVHIVLHGF